jgi:hypothetical protein
MPSMQIIELAVAIAFLIVLFLLMRRMGTGEAPLPYYSQEFLLSRGETAFYHTLRRAMPAHLMIFMKVRLSDIIGCSGEAWKAGYGAKISQKHVDFVLADADTTAIALVIELDDRTHQRAARQERDAFVDRALAAAGIPILRVATASTYDVRALRNQIAGLVRDTAAVGEQE